MKYDLVDLVTVAIATVSGATIGPVTATVCAVAAVASIVFWQHLMNRA
jgi:hypothetical protein